MCSCKIDFIILTLLYIIFTAQSANAFNEFCLHPDSPDYESNVLHSKFTTSSDVTLNVKFVKNANKNCINKHFPIILIHTNTLHDGWIQIIYTHSDDASRFIDYDPNFTKKPFYSHLQYFYDAPLWEFSLLKRSMLWKGHVFAIKMNHQNKTIQCICAIEWGFELQPLNLLPVAIEPKLLSENAWNDAWNFIKNTLPGYRKIS